MNKELDNFMKIEIDDPIDRFEYLKIFVRTKTIAFSMQRKRDMNIKYAAL